MYFVVLGAIAQMEREQMQERIVAGMESARKQGRKAGRKKVSTTVIRNAETLINAGSTYPEVAKSLGIGLSTLYKYVPVSENLEA